MNRHQTTKCGFTLTELAIVLGIAGIIIGAIWGATGSVSSSQRVETTNGQFIAITQGIRSLYSTSPSTQAAGGADGDPLTYNLCSANIFPSNMVPSAGCGTAAAPATITDLWGGTVTVTTASTTTASIGDAFSIEMDGLDQKGCVGLLLGEGGLARDSGLLYLVGGTAPTAYAVTKTTPFPILPATALTATSCNGTTGNKVIAVFKLKG